MMSTNGEKFILVHSVLYNSKQYQAMESDETKYSTFHCNTMQYNTMVTIQYDTIQLLAYIMRVPEKTY